MIDRRIAKAAGDERRKSHRRFMRRAASVLLAVVLFAAWAATLRPRSLGGPSAYVMVRGVSMLPTFQTGDLVITHPEHTYTEGDIVAYRVPSGIGEGAVVIHRIIGGSARHGYLMQGDNNSAPDPWHPRVNAIVGKVWLRAPKAGYALAWLHAPAPLASIAAGITAAFMLVPAGGGQPSRDSGPRGEEAAVEARDEKVSPRVRRPRTRFRGR